MVPITTFPPTSAAFRLHAVPALTGPPSFTPCLCTQSRSGGGGCGGGYTSMVWAAFSDSEGYRPEHCYPYAYDGNGAAHYTETVDVIFTCAEAYAARTDACTGADDYKVQVNCDCSLTSLSTLRKKCLWGRIDKASQRQAGLT